MAGYTPSSQKQEIEIPQRRTEVRHTHTGWRAHKNACCATLHHDSGCCQVGHSAIGLRQEIAFHKLACRSEVTLRPPTLARSSFMNNCPRLSIIVVDAPHRV